ncbi:MAG: hypothetical protein AAF702_07075 [Chloroflexota bacterium]
MNRIIRRGKTRILLITAAVLFGLILVIGATYNLPTNAQGLVTGRSAILIEQLVERVGARELVMAAAQANVIEVDQPLTQNDANIRRSRNANRRRDTNQRSNRREGRRSRENQQARERIHFQMSEDIEEQLERLGPEAVYQIAVDADLITQTEASRMLAQ